MKVKFSDITKMVDEKLKMMRGWVESEMSERERWHLEDRNHEWERMEKLEKRISALEAKCGIEQKPDNLMPVECPPAPYEF